MEPKYTWAQKDGMRDFTIATNGGVDPNDQRAELNYANQQGYTEISQFIEHKQGWNIAKNESAKDW